MAKTIIFLVGPTAVGKTAVAIELAKKIKAEIISCDSMQLYQGMDIITSKPSAISRKKVRQHLIDVIAPTGEYNVSRYRRDALKKIREIIKRDKVPLFVGGTGLYMSILIDGIFKMWQVNSKLRKRLYEEAENLGSQYLHRRLQGVDPEAATKIHPHDTRRIVRALEVFESTGKAISELQGQRKGLKSDYNLRIFCLNMARDKLYKKIEARVDEMFKQGLIKEVKNLLKLKLSKTASYAIGLRELKGYFAGVYSLAQAKELIKQNSRLYAKRQLTWFRKDKRIEWIEASEEESPKEIAQEIWKKLS